MYFRNYFITCLAVLSGVPHRYALGSPLSLPYFMNDHVLLKS
jgi:hypothetical protein